jgi:hypothetical protein
MVFSRAVDPNSLNLDPNTDPDPEFQVNQDADADTDPDPIRIQGFFYPKTDEKIKQNFLFFFF